MLRGLPTRILPMRSSLFRRRKTTCCRRVCAALRMHKFLLCAIDQPMYGFVAMTAIVKAGPARIAISTGGVSPRVGGLLRRALAGALDATFARFMACLALQRRRNRA